MFTRVVVAILFLSSYSVSHAALSQKQRAELFQQVEDFCRFASNNSSVITYEGSLEAGVGFKVFGIDGAGKISKKEYNNLSQLFKEFRADPTICRFEMIRTLTPLFSSSDETKSKYQNEFEKIWVSIPEQPDRSQGFLGFNEELDTLKKTFPKCEFDFPGDKVFCRVYVSGYNTVTLGKGTTSVVSMEWAGYKPPPSVIKKFSLAYGMNKSSDLYEFIASNTSAKLEGDSSRRSRMCLPGKFEAIVRTFINDKYGEMHTVGIQEIRDFCLG